MSGGFLLGEEKVTDVTEKVTDVTKKLQILKRKQMVLIGRDTGKLFCR